ncbi:hypothetical protein [Methylocapsa palsarum]|uniref:Uncharacterized protein n=1 Tax=Methylocapsa palsarum TaxID=1612308 RepID=A0A1I3X1R2_9HYPH|nr:hypothetical protein [Methylocapsa palsarum]SFK12751.1 hypothetical protein SAMN05444581_102255 [Methylocapsa palsarum]
MLSTIVFMESQTETTRQGRDPLEALVRTLASLVRANVEGLVRDVAIAGPFGLDLATVADHAGCGLFEAKNEAGWLRLAIEAARGPEVFLLRSGRAPDAGFIEEAGDFLASASRAGLSGDGRSRAARMTCAPENFVERLFPRAAPAAGLIAPRALLLAGPVKEFAGLARFVRPETTLRTNARRIG